MSMRSPIVVLRVVVALVVAVGIACTGGEFIC